MKRLSQEEMIKILKEAMNELNDYEKQLNEFRGKLENFDEAWNSVEANKAKETVFEITKSFEDAKRSLESAYNKIAKTTEKIQQANEEHLSM